MAGTLKKHGITEKTPQNLIFGAGSIYKNLDVNTMTGTILGATSGGCKLEIKPEYKDAELDGATVKVKGGTFKVGETASLEVNFTEFRSGVVVDSLHLVEDTSASVEGYKKFDTKEQLQPEDYLKNIAFVGTLVSGKQVIVVLDNAICLEGLEMEFKNKEQATWKGVFECTATFEQIDLNHVPVHIYYPESQVDAPTPSV